MSPPSQAVSACPVRRVWGWATADNPCKLQGFGIAGEDFSIYSSQPCHASQTSEVPFSAPALDPEGCLCIPVLQCCSLSPHLSELSLPSGSPLTFSETFLSLEKATAPLLWVTYVPGSCLGTFRCYKLPEQTSPGACSLPFCKLSLTLCGWEDIQFEFFILLKHSLILCVCDVAVLQFRG